jgi:hypothetical protein
MHFMHGFCNGNGRDAVAEYWQHFLNCRVPHWNILSQTFAMSVMSCFQQPGWPCGVLPRSACTQPQSFLEASRLVFWKQKHLDLSTQISAVPNVWCNGYIEAFCGFDSQLWVDCSKTGWWQRRTYKSAVCDQERRGSIQTLRREWLIPVWKQRRRLNEKDLWFTTVKNCKQEHNYL